jgi:signal transduction histidine kinase
VREQFTRFDRSPGSSLPAAESSVRTANGDERIWGVHTVALAPLPDGRKLHLTAAVDVTAFRQLLERERFARQQAEDANRAKSDFLTMMSHELRTPLNAIGGYAQIMSMGIRGPLTEEQQLDLQRIDKSQRHLLSLINDILNFAKIEAGHVAFDIEPVPLRTLLRDVEPLLKPQLSAKSIQYADTVGECDALVLADEEKARQVLLNLLSNAIKFTPPQGSITVTCAVSDDAVAVTVRDSGIGIAVSKLQAIFEPFVQLARDYASPQEGTGLGLAISRDLARRMGGDLEVESELGRGAAFTLTLPRAAAVVNQVQETVGRA